MTNHAGVALAVATLLGTLLVGLADAARPLPCAPEGRYIPTSSLLEGAGQPLMPVVLQQTAQGVLVSIEGLCPPALASKVKAARALGAPVTLVQVKWKEPACPVVCCGLRLRLKIVGPRCDRLGGVLQSRSGGRAALSGAAAP